MDDLIIDTSVLVDALRGRREAIDFLDAQRASAGLATHVIVVAELLAGARDAREQSAIDSFVSAFSVLSPTDVDALRALDLYRQFHLSHGVDWPDCQIAATALRLGARVATQNMKHFIAFSGLRVIQSY